jgi:hypothetical protein
VYGSGGRVYCPFRDAIISVIYPLPSTKHEAPVHSLLVSKFVDQECRESGKVPGDWGKKTRICERRFLKALISNGIEDQHWNI